MKKYCYCNGKIQELSKARVAPNDIGLLRGYAVFDFLRTEHGKLFLFKEHFARLKRSAAMLDLKVPISEAACLKVIKQLLRKNKVKDASFRLVLSGGPTEDGMSFRKPNFFILVEDRYDYPDHVFQKGGTLISHEHERQFAEAKTTNYLTAIKLQKAKKSAGAVEILYISRGKVLEASTSNFFLVKGNNLVTAKDHVLGGTIRQVIISLAKKLGWDVEERDVFVGELKEADEAFITATNKKVTPIVKIDKLTIANGRVGPKTKQLLTAFEDYIAK